MTYVTLRCIFIVFAILASSMFLVSVFLFLKLNIPKAFGDVTGGTMKKALKDLNPDDSPKSEYTEKLDAYVTSGRENPRREPPAVSPEPSAEESGATTVLGEQEPPAQNLFEVESDITFIHTDFEGFL